MVPSSLHTLRRYTSWRSHPEVFLLLILLWMRWCTTEASCIGSACNSSSDFRGLTVANQTVLFFIGISSRPVASARSLRETQRRTWLKWAISDHRVSHNFFINDESAGYEVAGTKGETDVVIVPAAKISHCPRGNGRPAHNCRSGALVRYLLFWGLRMTRANFIVATEHDGFVCLPQLILESSTWSSSVHMAHYAGDCSSNKLSMFNPEQTFNVFGRGILARIFSLIEGAGSSYYIPSITFAQNIQPILRYLNQRREVEILPDLDRIITGIKVKEHRPNPITKLCIVGHLYFHFRESINQMLPKSVEMKELYDRIGDKRTPSLESIREATVQGRRRRLSCSKNSCPLPAGSDEWWSCPLYGKQLAAKGGLDPSLLHRPASSSTTRPHYPAGKGKKKKKKKTTTTTTKMADLKQEIASKS